MRVPAVGWPLEFSHRLPTTPVSFDCLAQRGLEVSVEDRILEAVPLADIRGMLGQRVEFLHGNFGRRDEFGTYVS